MNDTVLPAQSLFPLVYGESLAVKSEIGVTPSVTGLFGRCCPSNVARFVVPSVIGVAVNGMLWCWLWPKHFVELLKRGKQVLDTLSSIVRKFLVIGVVTAVKNVAPRSVLWASRHPVFGTSGTNQFTLEAPAAQGVAASQIFFSDRTDNATFAATEPTFAINRGCFDVMSNDGQPTIDITDVHRPPGALRVVGYVRFTCPESVPSGS